MSDAALPGAHLAQPVSEAASDNIFSMVQRFCFKSAAWVGIYMLGYYDFSVAWLLTPLLLTVLRSQWKKERDAKLSAARHAAIVNEKVMIESRIRVEDLPSWVFFPDKERAEWINSILQQLWPNVGHYTRKLISESIEPAVKKALEGYGLNGFKFERVVLGQIPPRITGIKVYDKNVSRKEIIMDMDIVFASDCDIKFSVGKIKAKIMDFSLRGLLRVVFKPIVNEIPLIGGVQVYFLTPPDIDFDLGGIANAFDAPGLSNLIRKIVLEQIGYFMVLPHKYTMPLIDSVDNKVLKCPDSAGVLRVRLHRAVQLVKKDMGVLGMGKSDPYAVLTVGARTLKTKRINNTVNPEWNFVADFPIEVVKGQQLSIEVLDHDDPGEDEFLGRATVQTSVVAAKGEINDMWVELEDIPTGRALMSLSWMEATSDKSALDRKIPKEDADLAKCLLHVYVDSCKNLAPIKGTGKKPCPMVELRVGQTDPQVSFPQYYTLDPVFEQGFVFLISNPHSDDLSIKIVDTGHTDNVLGEAMVRVSDVIKQPGMEMANQPIHLKGGKGGMSLTLAAQVKALKEPGKHSVPMAGMPGGDDAKDEKKAASPAAKTEAESKKQESAAGSSKSASDAPAPAPRSPSPAKMGGALSHMVAGTVAPMADQVSEPVSEIITEEATGLRQRLNAAPSDDTTGKIKLSLKYNQDKALLGITVHAASGLPGSDLPDPPDPYVKLYMLPERSKKSKRKTEVVKDTTEPEFEEVFEYEIPAAKIGLCQLEVTVVDRKGIFARSPLMGRAIVDLDNPELVQGVSQWYDLHDDDDDSE